MNNDEYAQIQEYIDTEQYEKALNQLKPLAEKGDTFALNKLGYLYQFGYGVKADGKKAIQLYLPAAKQGDTWAMLSISSVYNNGNGGVPKDMKKAVAWQRKAAELGNTTAMSNMSYYYRKGLGVAKNLDKADYWEKLAASKGDTFGMEMRKLSEKWEQLAKEEDSTYSEYKTGSVKLKSVLVRASCTAGLGYCLAEDLTLSAPYGSGIWTPNSASGAWSNIFPNSHGDLAGTYQYTIRLDLGGNEKRLCSGSFTIDGSKPNVTIDVFQDCRLSYVNAF